MVLALLTLLMAGGKKIHAEGHEIPTRTVRIAAVSLVSAAGSGPLLREIDDPNSGRRWLLVRDKTNPGGPGRLELAPERDAGVLRRQVQAPAAAQIWSAAIIRPGDKLVVEEHSAITDAYLEGVALGPAGPGSALNVRLSIGGRIVRAVAVAPGRAALEAGAGGRR
jgi:hypothetical protein